MRLDVHIHLLHVPAHSQSSDPEAVEYTLIQALELPDGRNNRSQQRG